MSTTDSTNAALQKNIKSREKMANMIINGNMNRTQFADLMKGLKKFYNAKKVSDTVFPNTSLRTLLAQHNIAEAVPLLVSLRVNMTEENGQGYSPALAAARHGSLDFLKALHDAGINILTPVKERNILDLARDKATRQFIINLTTPIAVTAQTTLENTLA